MEDSDVRDNGIRMRNHIFHSHNNNLDKEEIKVNEEKGSVVSTGIKDSGKREDFSTGSRRDTNDGKVRPDLLPSICEFFEGAHFAMGAVKYGDNNWQLGQPIMRYYESLKRHTLYWGMGDISENHMNGVRWNSQAILFTLIMIDHGQLPKELDNRPFWMRPNNPIGKELMETFEKDVKILQEKLKAKKALDAMKEIHAIDATPEVEALIAKEFPNG